jgi:hypothetical protein
VVVGMSPTLTIFFYKLEVFLGYQKIMNPKDPKHLKGGGVKKIRDFMKVEEGGVHHKKYDGHCMKH